jgi:membrane-bound lytic murein transglycosylase A
MIDVDDSVLGQARLVPSSFAEIEGFSADDHLEAFRVFAGQAKAIIDDRPPLRPALSASVELRAVSQAALVRPIETQTAARRFFVDHFMPFSVMPAAGGGFVTGYYEPVVAGSLAPSAEFTAPILALPADLVTLPQGSGLPGRPELSAARRLSDGTLVPYPDRAEIEAGAGLHRPLVWLKDSAEVFLAQVQGSARVILPDRRQIRLAYAGRNGWPYTSIGRILIESGEIASSDMSLAALKTWIRTHGQNPGEAGAMLMRANRSYVFFAIDGDLADGDGPIGGAGVSLSSLRSIAVDRSLWSYGMPFWLNGNLPWEKNEATPFRRLMIGQDTGSAMVGPARADIFFGSGETAGALAGGIRHKCDVVVLLPRGKGDFDRGAHE